MGEGLKRARAAAIATRVPKALSKGEAEFELHCRIYGLTPVRELKFHPSRKWRLDFAWPERMVALEVDGGTWSGGRHSRGKGYEEDCRKMNAAGALGWRVFKATTEMVSSGEAIDTMRKVLK